MAAARPNKVSFRRAAGIRGSAPLRVTAAPVSLRRRVVQQGQQRGGRNNDSFARFTVSASAAAAADGDAGLPSKEFLSAPEKPPEKVSGLQYKTLATLFTAHTFIYMVRKPLSVVKAPMQASLGLPTSTLGLIDSCFLATYALGQLTLPAAGEKMGFSGKNMLVAAYVVGAAACVGFGMTSVPLLLCAVWALNGLANSLVHPLHVKILSPWFGSGQRGFAMGIWAASQQLGGVLSTALAAFLLGIIGWRMTIVAPAIFVVASAVLIAFMQEDPPWSKKAKKKLVQGGGDAEVPSMLEVLRIPKLGLLMTSYFFVKMVRYCLIFWLPFYLFKECGLSPATAGYMSCAYDFGGIAGGLIAGIICDKYFEKRRPIFGALMCVLLTMSILAYMPACQLGPAVNVLVMGLVGFFVAGPDAMLGAASISDTVEAAGYGQETMGTASGLVNGAGSTGAVVQGVLTAWIADSFGWGALFTTLAALSAISVVTLLLAVPKQVEADNCDPTTKIC